jgi:hypothetical protein
MVAREGRGSRSRRCTESRGGCRTHHHRSRWITSDGGRRETGPKRPIGDPTGITVYMFTSRGSPSADFHSWSRKTCHCVMFAASPSARAASLSVRARRRPRGRLDQPLEQLIGHRIGLEPAHGAHRAHHLEQRGVLAHGHRLISHEGGPYPRRKRADSSRPGSCIGASGRLPTQMAAIPAAIGLPACTVVAAIGAPVYLAVVAFGVGILALAIAIVTRNRSAGIACWDGGEPAQTLIARAEQALARAKRAGGATIVLRSTAPPGSRASRVQRSP